MAAQRAEILPAPAGQLGRHVLGEDDGRDRHHAAAKALAQGHDVGPALATLEGEGPAGATEPGDHLVGDPQRTGLAGEAGDGVLIGAVVIEAALGIVDDDRCGIGELGLGAGEALVERRRARRGGAAGDIERALGSRQHMDERARRRNLGAAVRRGDAAVPVRLHGDVAAQADQAVIGPLARCDRLAAGEGLRQRQREIVGLAAAQAEAHRARPVLLARKTDLEQAFRRLVASLPVPAFVDHGQARGLAQGFGEARMAMAERPAGIAAVEHFAAVAEMKIDALATYHLRGGRAGVEARPKQSAHCPTLASSSGRTVGRRPGSRQRQFPGYSIGQIRPSRRSARPGRIGAERPLPRAAGHSPEPGPGGRVRRDSTGTGAGRNEACRGCAVIPRGR